MTSKLPGTCALLLSLASPAGAHRLDEYLQATMLSVQRGRIEAQMSLVPGIAIFPRVLERIDTDRDGLMSDAEQRTYAEHVLLDLSLAVDGNRLPLRLTSWAFSDAKLLEQGLGEIRLEFSAEAPREAGDRQLTFENRHARGIAVYLVNSLVPSDTGIHVTTQNRSHDQSVYRLNYTRGDVRTGLVSTLSWTELSAWLGTAALIVLAGIALRRAVTPGRRPVTDR